MHIAQAFKMACKSLWTNKLRSFLTMLGIIIGVVTVALLTSVASGVSNAVVSSIRSQSTLAVMMNNSTDMTVSYVDTLLKTYQHEETDDDYYDYSLVYSSYATIANDLTNAKVDNNFILIAIKARRYETADYLLQYYKDIFVFVPPELFPTTTLFRNLKYSGIMGLNQDDPILNKFYFDIFEVICDD